MRRKLRLTILIVAGSIGVLALAAVVTAYFMLQPQRVTNLLRAQAQRVGLELTLSAPAQPALWPHPAVVLHGLTLSADNRPVLVAARARLVLPWHALLGGSPAITRLELDTFQLDLGQLRKLLNRSHGAGSMKPFLPRINTGIRISHGTLVNGGTTLLDHLRIRTGALAMGEPFSVNLAATTRHGQTVSAALTVTPKQGDGLLQFDDIRFDLRMPSLATISLKGHGQWQGGEKMQLHLDGIMTRPPARRYALQVDLAPSQSAASDQPLLHLSMTGAGVNANGYVSPEKLLAWWRNTANSSTTTIGLPPLTGSLYAQHVTLGKVRIDGLDIVTSDIPAVPASAPAAAASTAVKP